MSNSAPTQPKITAVRPLDNSVELDFDLPDELLYFQGHFPNFPILPGVTQIDWAIRYADEYLGTAIKAGCDFQVKFRSVIRPGKLITLALRISDRGHRMAFEYSNEDGVLSSGSVRLGGLGEA